MLPGKILGLFYMYGLMIAIGVLLCLGLLYYYGRKKKVEERFIDYVFYNGIASIAIGFGSATLFQSVYNYIDAYKKYGSEAVFEFGGMTFIGGVIGGVVCFFVIHAFFRKRYKTSLLRIQSFAPCAILIAHGFGRLGCLFAGCCHGFETDAWYGVRMWSTTYLRYGNFVPTQLFEALFLFALFAVCFLLVMKKDFKYNFTIYLIAYGIWRFFIEFIRDDSRGSFVNGLTPSQFWAIVMVIAGVACYFFLRFLYKLEEKKAALAVEQGEDTVTESQTIFETTSETVTETSVVASEEPQTDTGEDGL